MTTIAGLVHGSTVHLAGDSCVEFGDRVEIMREPKVWVAGGVALGVAGSLRGLQLLRHSFKVPALPKSDTDAALYRWITVQIPKAIRACYGEEKDVECDLLLGVRGRLFVLDSDFAWLRPPDGIGAVGVGSDSAVSNLRAGGKRAKPKVRLARALSAATAQNGATRPWFQYVSA